MYTIPIIGCLVLIVIIITAVLAVRRRKKPGSWTDDEYRAYARKVVDDVLKRCKQPSARRWVGSNNIEFVHLIVGKQNVKYTLMWARVFIEKADIAIVIEHVKELPAHILPLAYAISREFQARGIKSGVITCSRRPKLEELGVSGVTISTT